MKKGIYMKMKLFIIILCCLGIVEIKNTLHASSAELSQVTSEMENVSSGATLRKSAGSSLSVRYFQGSSEIVDELRDSQFNRLAEMERRVSVLEQQRFAKEIEEFKTYFSQLDMKKLNLELSWTEIDSKLSRLDNIKLDFEKLVQDVNEVVGGIHSRVAIAVQHVAAAEKRLELVEYHLGNLRLESKQLVTKIYAIEHECISSGSLAKNSIFMQEVEIILARLLVEKYSRQSQHVFSKDDDSFPSGRASTCSHRSTENDDEFSS
jgi:chaperonin cofactor prefoldin